MRKSTPMNAESNERKVRNVLIDGHRTSLRLEQPFWDGAEACASDLGITLHQLVSLAARQSAGESSVSSAVRSFVIKHFHDRATNAA